ncbi:hypothetical protein DRE_07740 [Drechslerella stenobrocha 248]|uniref:Uncharacterized protein n=1 Tax=Drechslerella stenobrocha 248 TaxID=1043628 RepID=W7HWI0_9PEZI|nr:hypothetical protein DRE_07740 [Drechslerella stenobrocha 248]
MFSVDPLLVMRSVGNGSSRAFRRLSDKAKDDLRLAIETAAAKPKSTTFLKRDDSKTLASNADAELEADAFTPSAPPSQDSAATATTEETPTGKKFQLPPNWRSYLPDHPRWKIYDEWQPKRFMNLFAFIPRYLEVNHNICHAVYLRHPVARSGSTEIPNPFNNETMQLAYNWYLRRR